MKNLTIKNILVPAAVLLFFVASCKKQDDWLDVKRAKSDVVPSTLKDFQAILDNDAIMNQGFPGLGLVGIDNYYVPYASWQSTSPADRNGYIWKPDIFEGSTVRDWNQMYQMIQYANIVLDGLKKIEVNTSNQTDYNNAKGSALFFRAFGFYQLTSLFCKPYISSSAATDLGIPLRLSSDINIVSKRTTVQQTYDQIIGDLKLAESLVPVTPLYQTRPSKPAVDGLLARVYLNMDDYSNANKFSNAALANYNTLLDYNSLPNTIAPVPPYPNNKEVVFWAVAFSYDISGMGGYGYCDTSLFQSYNDNDLRKQEFYYYDGVGELFFGSYASDLANFSGIATDELYLIRAESYARLNNTTAAMQDLNTLLQKRWRNSVSYTAVTASDANDALNKILVERRKELPFTVPLRWDDLRRLNKDTRFAKTLTRNLNGQIYTLPPNDNRYVYPIGQDEINLSGLQQNPR